MCWLVQWIEWRKWKHAGSTIFMPYLAIVKEGWLKVDEILDYLLDWIELNYSQIWVSSWW